MISLECKTLGKVKIFRDIDPRRLQLIAFVSNRVSYLADEAIFERGSPSDAVFIVIKGEVDLMRLDSEGRETLIERFGEGRSFGEVSVLNDRDRIVTAVAHTDCCLLKISKPDFLDLLHELPELAVSVMRDLARRIETMARQFESAGGV